MSNHCSAANLKFPGDDARLDFTDLFAFEATGDPDKTILIMDVNPYTSGMGAMPPFLMKSEFHPDGVYRLLRRSGSRSASPRSPARSSGLRAAGCRRLPRSHLLPGGRHGRRPAAWDEPEVFTTEVRAAFKALR